MTPMGWAILLIIIGLLLLVAEVFIPSGGIIFVLSIVALVVGVTMVFYAPPSEGGGLYGGIVTLAILFVVIPVVVGVAFHYWPKTPIGKKFFLPTREAEGSVPELLEQPLVGHLQGQIGQTVTPLRPCGVTLIQGHRFDTTTQGMFVEAGQWVRVVEVRPGTVVVRPLSDRELGQLPEDLRPTL